MCNSLAIQGVVTYDGKGYQQLAPQTYQFCQSGNFPLYYSIFCQHCHQLVCRLEYTCGLLHFLAKLSELRSHIMRLFMRLSNPQQISLLPGVPSHKQLLYPYKLQK